MKKKFINVNSFRINSYEQKFIKVIVTTEQSIYIFVTLCRTSVAFQYGLICRDQEILVAEECFDNFLELTNNLGMSFISKEYSKIIRKVGDIEFGIDLYSMASKDGQRIAENHRFEQ